MTGKITEIIAKRRSCRNFLQTEVSLDAIYLLLESARWAPSGKNGQPWRFVIVTDSAIKENVANCSLYKNKMKDAATFIVVFLDKSKSYNYKKDLLAIGAAIENICLQATEMDLGTWWVGDVLEKEDVVNHLLKVPEFYELMAIICVGYAKKSEKRTDRLPLDEIVYRLI